MPDKTHVYDTAPGVVRSVIFNEDAPDEFTIKTDYDYTNLADANKLSREAHDTKATNKVLARVPMFIYEQSVREQWDDVKWKHFLNDPDNKIFRVWEGRV